MMLSNNLSYVMLSKNLSYVMLSNNFLYVKFQTGLKSNSPGEWSGAFRLGAEQPLALRIIARTRRLDQVLVAPHLRQLLPQPQLVGGRDEDGRFLLLQVNRCPQVKVQLPPFLPSLLRSLSLPFMLSSISRGGGGGGGGGGVTGDFLLAKKEELSPLGKERSERDSCA
jgi:hypothetical protein